MELRKEVDLLLELLYLIHFFDLNTSVASVLEQLRILELCDIAMQLSKVILNEVRESTWYLFEFFSFHNIYYFLGEILKLSFKVFFVLLELNTLVA